jgi:phosphoglycolate phosphatase
VLTNKPEAPSRRLLEAFGLADFFPRVVGGDSGFARKPEPAGLQWLMRDAGAESSTTWLVGDSMIDVQTSRRAGVRMCVALYGFGQMRGELVLDGSERTVERPAEIPAIVSS